MMSVTSDIKTLFLYYSQTGNSIPVYNIDCRYYKKNKPRLTKHKLTVSCLNNIRSHFKY